jgi:hypothetical protein
VRDAVYFKYLLTIQDLLTNKSSWRVESCPYPLYLKTRHCWLHSLQSHSVFNITQHLQSRRVSMLMEFSCLLPPRDFSYFRFQCDFGYKVSRKRQQAMQIKTLFQHFFVRCFIRPKKFDQQQLDQKNWVKNKHQEPFVFTGLLRSQSVQNHYTCMEVIVHICMLEKDRAR